MRTRANLWTRPVVRLPGRRMRHVVRPAVTAHLAACIVVTLAVASVTLQTAHGQIIDWTGGGDGTTYTDAANWDGVNIPDTIAEDARFDSGTFPNNVSFGGGSSTTVGDLLVFELTFFATDAGATANASYDIDDQLLIDEGILVVEDSDSTFDVDITVANQVNIKNGGALVLNGGTFNANTNVVMNANSNLTLDGGALNANAGLNNLEEGVLDFLDGTLTVAGGAFYPNAGGPTAIYEIDAPTFGKTPHLVIDAGATANFGDDLRIGNLRQGELTISGGGAVSNEDGVIGRLSSSTGTVTVDGASWTNTSNLVVGNSGNGTLNIQNSGVVFSAAGSVASESGTGTATVDGVRSLWSNSGDLSIGNQGNGTLVIRDFAVVTSDRTYLGDLAGGSGQGTLHLENGGQLDPVDSLQIRRTGLLQGSGTVASLVNNDGRIAPGPMAGTLFINDDFTQTTDGVLEIEIGGLAPGIEHDQLIISGAAFLGGRLEVPLIDIGGGVFTPDIDDEVVFLKAASVAGTFDSLFSPNLGTVNPNLAIEVVSNQTDMRVRFVAPNSSTTFGGTAPASNWADAANWSTETVPGSTDIVSVNNLAGTAQLLEVVFNQNVPGSGNAFVHEATVAGAGQPLTVSVKSGSKFSATLGVTVANLGVFELDGGEVLAGSVQVDSGGTVTGNGTVVGNLTVGDGGGGGVATLSPGLSVGQINVEGNYQQQPGSQLVIEIDGINPGQFDAIDVTGQATLDGVVEIILDDIAHAPVGSVINFISADGITGTFARMITTGVDDYFLAPIYGGETPLAALSAAAGGAPAAAGAMVFEEGDMDPSVPGLGEEDAVAFALALTDPDTYVVTYGIDPIESGNIDDDSDFDFDDIQPFVDLLNGSLVGGMTMAQMLEIIQDAQHPVPEPSSLAMSLMGCYLMLLLRRLRCCPT